jgi:Protein of unknown function (DUF2550)
VLIALLAVLGVDLWVIVVLLAVVLTRKRWVSHQPGAFKGAIRIIDGDVPGLKGKWKRGYGRWVRDILVWTKTPFLFRNELVAANALAGDPRAAKSSEVKRLGKHPAIILLEADRGARIEVATSEEGRERASGPFAALTPGQSASNTGTQTTSDTMAGPDEPRH